MIIWPGEEKKMVNKYKWILLIIILITGLITGCRRGEEEELPEKIQENQRTEINEELEPIGEIRETEIKALIKDPSNWVHFKEDFFKELLEHRIYVDSRLSYENFYQGIDYRLMMEEEAVVDLFGSPNTREEDPFAYRMYVLEYDGLIIQINDYDHGAYATGYYIRSPEFSGPRGTYVGQSVGEVLIAFPLPEKEEVFMEPGQIYWGEETEFYGAHMAGMHLLEDGEITEVRYAEGSGFAGVVFEIFEGVVQSIYFFEMN